jgi:hypothetical protein
VARPATTALSDASRSGGICSLVIAYTTDSIRR